MKIKKLKFDGKVLNVKEQKEIKGGRGCSCQGDNQNYGNGPWCQEC